MLFDVLKTQANRINPSTALTGMGITGVFTTAFLTGRASFKAARLIDREIAVYKSDPDAPKEPLTKKDKVKLVWPLYIPPAGTAATTVVAIVMANQTASKKIAALTVASGISERALTEYKAKVVEKLGENKAIAIRDEIAQDRVNVNPPNNSEVLIAGTGDVLCFDVLTGRYFISSHEKLRRAENAVNYDIIAHDYASLSSFYDEIGLAPTPMSDQVGWTTSNRLELELSSVLTKDNRPCLSVDFASPPQIDYNRIW